MPKNWSSLGWRRWTIFHAILSSGDHAKLSYLFGSRLAIEVDDRYTHLTTISLFRKDTTLRPVIKDDRKLRNSVQSDWKLSISRNVASIFIMELNYKIEVSGQSQQQWTTERKIYFIFPCVGVLIRGVSRGFLDTRVHPSGMAQSYTNFIYLQSALDCKRNKSRSDIKAKQTTTTRTYPNIKITSPGSQCALVHLSATTENFTNDVYVVHGNNGTELISAKRRTGRKLQHQYRGHLVDNPPLL